MARPPGSAGAGKGVYVHSRTTGPLWYRANRAGRQTSEHLDRSARAGRPALSAEQITFGAAALPEPDPTWLAAVERLPIESVWHGGHLLPPTATGEAITRLALLTAWTERVRVGSAVLVLPLYHPVIVAKQIADLD